MKFLSDIVHFSLIEYNKGKNTMIVRRMNDGKDENCRDCADGSPENFDAELGRKIARQNAVSKMWPLMGYALKEKLHNEVA